MERGWLRLAVDLHIHTVASACAEPEMVPPNIVRRASQLGLGAIAVTDHHSAENIRSVIEAAAPFGIHVLAGMEVQSREDVHVLCLFSGPEHALAFQEAVWSRLPQLENRQAFFGEQWIVDPKGNRIGKNPRLLQTSVIWSFEEVLRAVEQCGGLALPAHVDRPRYSLFSNLGMVPESVKMAGAEISRHISPREARTRFPGLQGVGLIQNGDAHRLEEMIRTTKMTVCAITLEELYLALRGEEQRDIVVEEYCKSSY